MHNALDDVLPLLKGEIRLVRASFSFYHEIAFLLINVDDGEAARAAPRPLDLLIVVRGVFAVPVFAIDDAEPTVAVPTLGPVVAQGTVFVVV